MFPLFLFGRCVSSLAQNFSSNFVPDRFLLGLLGLLLGLLLGSFFLLLLLSELRDFSPYLGHLYRVLRHVFASVLLLHPHHEQWVCVEFIPCLIPRRWSVC